MLRQIWLRAADFLNFCRLKRHLLLLLLLIGFVLGFKRLDYSFYSLLLHNCGCLLSVGSKRSEITVFVSFGLRSFRLFLLLKLGTLRLFLFLILSFLLFQVIELFLVFFLQFLPGKHCFQYAFLLLDSKSSRKQIVEDASLVDVRININGSAASNPEFLHFLLRNASGPMVGEDFG